MFGEGMRVSKEAQQGLKKEWDAYRSLVPAYHGPDIVAYRSPANSVAKHMRPWRSLPAVFMIAWGLIGLLNFLRF